VKQVLTFYRNDQIPGRRFPPSYLGQGIASHHLRDLSQIHAGKDQHGQRARISGGWRAIRRSLHQVLLNLCVNSRDAMPDGGQLTIKAENVMVASPLMPLVAGQTKPSAHVLISVRDTGLEFRLRSGRRFSTRSLPPKLPAKAPVWGSRRPWPSSRTTAASSTVSSEPGQGSIIQGLLPALEGPAVTAAHTEHIPDSARQRRTGAGRG
jgi:hypothetical protein